LSFSSVPSNMKYSTFPCTARMMHRIWGEYFMLH